MTIKTLARLITTWFVICAYLFSEGAFAAGLQIEVMPERETPSFLQIEIPSRLAQVEEIYEAPPKIDPNLIIHVQNAHGSYDAQVKIKELLKFLYEKYNFRLFFVEGAVERLNPDALRMFPENSQNVELADRLAREGKITGAEFFLIDAPGQVEAVGIEHAELYRANYEAFKQVYAGEKITGAYLKEAETRLTEISNQRFSKELRRIVTEWRRFSSGHRDFLPYVNRLAADARQYLNIEMETLFAQIEWPQITRLLLLQSMEEDVDFEKGKMEKEEVVKFLRRINISKEVVDAVADIEESHIRMNRLGTMDERLENLPRHLIERLTAEAGPKGFHFKNYPSFSLYAGYHILKSELDSRALFDEIDLLFSQILDEAAASGEEKELLRLYRDLELLQKLFTLELTREDYDEFQRRKPILNPSKMAERISMLDKNERAFADGGVQSVYESAVMFYQLARQRENVFYYSIKKGMTAELEEKSTLLTGGFHTAGVFERFREDEVNYGILMPKIRGEISRDNYVKTMLRTHPTTFQASTIEAPSPMHSNQALRDIGFNPADFAEDVLLSGAALNLEWLKGASYYDAAQFASVFNSTVGRFRKYSIIFDPDDDEKVYLYYEGRFLTNADGTYKTLAVKKMLNSNGDEVKMILPVTVAGVTQPPQNPVLPKDDEAEAADLPDGGEAIPSAILNEAEPQPPAVSRLAAYQSERGIFKNSLQDFFERASGIRLGTAHLNYLNDIDLANLPEGAEGKRALAVVSSFVAAGVLGPNPDINEVRAILTAMLARIDAAEPDIFKRLDAAKQAAGAYASEAPGILIRLRKTALSQKEIDSVISQLTLNPNLKIGIVFTGPEGRNIARTVDREIRNAIGQAGLQIPGLSERLSVEGAVENKSSVTTTIRQRLYQPLRQLEEKAGIRPAEAGNEPKFLLFAEEGLSADSLINFDLAGNLDVLSSNIGEHLDTQAFIAGAFSQRLDKLDRTDPYMEAIKLKGDTLRQDTVNQVQRYDMERGPLDVLSRHIQAIVQSISATLRLQSAA